MKKEWQKIITKYNGNWDYISHDQKLSEEFIREFQHRVDWYWISKYQTLSESFIEEFQNSVYWKVILKRYQDYSFVIDCAIAYL